MGAIKKAIDDAVGKADEEKIKERLQLLLVAAKAKLKGYKDDINEQFMNPGQVDKIQIPGIRAYKYIEQYHVASSSSLNQDFSDHLNNAIDAFFSIGGKDDDTKSSIKNGLKSVIAGALDAFIGTTEAGESEEKIFFVVPENNSFVRVDVSLWKYHMKDSGIVDNKDTAIAYILCKSVVDHTKLKLDELIYLTSEALSSQDYTPLAISVYRNNETGEEKKSLDTKAAIPEVEKEGVDSTKKEVRFTLSKNTYVGDSNQLPVLKDPTLKGKKIAPSTINYEDDPANWREWLGGSRSTPSVKDVQAYLDELIAIWKKLNAQMKEEK